MSKKYTLAALSLIAVALCGGENAFVTAQTTTAQTAAAKPAAASAMTADQIVAKHIEALGGAEKLKAIKTVKMTGKAMVQNTIEAPMTMYVKRPEMMRFDLNIQGRTLTQGYDGTAGWMINPFAGAGAAEKMSEEDTKGARENADIDGSLVDYKAKGHTVEAMGTEDFEGTPVHKLKVTKKSGDIQYIYLDAENYLPLKITSKRKMMGNEVETETIVGDYKPVAGVMMSHSMESRINGKPQFAISMEKIEANVSVEDSMFKMPTAPDTKPAAAAKP